MRSAFILAILLFTLPVLAGAETVNRVAAVVNAEPITLYQLTQELQTRTATGEIPTGDEERGKHLVLEQMIEDALIRQRSEHLGIRVSTEEMDAAVQDVLQQNQLTQEQLEAALHQQGMTLPDYRRNLRQQLIRYKLLGREVQARAEVTSYEIREYFRKHIDEYRDHPHVRLNRLSFPIPPRATGEEIEAIRRKAEAALTRLRQREDFTAVLLAFSADRSAEGGDMGSFAEGELAAAFARATDGLPEGGISDLVEAPQAFHILQVAERNPGGIRHFDSVKDEIARTLGERKTKERLHEWVAELRKSAMIEIRI